jgi:hypothetical protein
MLDRLSVTIHNTVSADGRLTGLPVDLGLHYKIVATFRHETRGRPRPPARQPATHHTQSPRTSTTDDVCDRVATQDQPG